MSTSPLLEAYRSLKREIRLITSTELKRFNLGEKQMLILFLLNERQEASASDLAFQTQSDPAAVTRAVQSMEEAGLLERETDSMDNRRFLFKLTPKGKDKAESLEVIREEVKRRIEKTLSQKELKELERLMRTVAKGLLTQREQ